MSKLKINVGLRQRKVRHPQGYRGGLENLRKSVTALVTHERIELNENRAVTVRQYTEKLISDAILYGDKHKHTMEMAQWWLEEVSATYYIIHNYQLLMQLGCAVQCQNLTTLHSGILNSH